MASTHSELFRCGNSEIARTGSAMLRCDNPKIATTRSPRRMSHYHLSAHDVITRSKGDKVIRVAAYAAREKLRDERYGETHNFTRRRHELLYSTMLAPDLAPEWTRNRQQFCNAVEEAEKRKDSQLGIPYDIALPHELTLEQNIALITAYCQKEFVSRGLVVDLNLHQPDPKKDQRNIHAHILIPTRPVDEHGFTKKQRNANSRKSWQQERKENIERLRKSWADIHNLHIAAAGFDNSHHIDHRSYAEQGIRLEPTTHRGVASDHMEERGITTNRGDEYRDIQAENEKRSLQNGKPSDYAEKPEASFMPDAQSDQQKIEEEAIRKEQERQEQARRDQDKLQNELVAADKNLKELGQIYREAQQIRESLVKQAQELEAANHRWEQQQEQRQREEQRRQNPYDDYTKEQAVAVENRRQDLIVNRDRQYLEGDIRDPAARYAQALHHNYDFLGDPYMSLAKVAIAEHAAFRKEQEVLSAEIAKTADPKLREVLEIRRKIEGYDYLSMAGERVAVQSILLNGRKDPVTGRLDSEEAKKMRERINGKEIKDENNKVIGYEPGGYKQKAQALRDQYRDLQAERSKDQEAQYTRAPRPRAGRSKTSLDERIKQQDDAAKAREAEQLAKMTPAERAQHQQNELERKRKLERDR
jgi:hypothetical protein